ncbi:MAG: hypothetical protein DMG07_06740 [Acidobacteria bacterium]|nr:MAG: hypothetical protein DMG07_06740 [Acidobacteriota bacterium]
MFSRLGSRLQGATQPLYALRQALVEQGLRITDLVSGNVNEHGIVFPPDLLEEILVESARAARLYAPDPLGRPAAREAVAAYYRAQGIALSAEQILLTPGTSISYWYAFKLAADEGEEVLCPCPSYPLFDYIAALAGVRIVPYRMLEAAGWEIDLDQLDASVSTRTRALVVISPHNPTGHVVSAAALAGIAEIARRHDLVIIADEVFGDFLLTPGILPRPAAGDAPLVLTLNGFSKMLALPGMKLGWMAASGDAARVGEAMRALELISDTFLPVNEIVQAAVAALLDRGRDFRQSYAREIRARYRTARALLSGSPAFGFVEPQGGFYLTLELRADTFLPVNEIVQAAVAALLDRGTDFRQSFAREIRARYRTARALLSGSPAFGFVEPQGGFYLTLELRGMAEQAAAEALLREGILVHPGSFYDIGPDHLVLAFVQEPELQAEAYARLRRRLER